ncbi:hypothetical protein Syun_001845 [Stephania yunnanensis]|uniref:Uncharacterized protein n=1 Tax=Stephania yunnanensis TaxID=152371 RepID=A0AAP0Q6V5_9MAGN
MCTLNHSFMMKLAWEILANRKGLQTEIIKRKYHLGGTQMDIHRPPTSTSNVCKGILKVWEKVLEGALWAISDGEKTLFCVDRWATTQFPSRNYSTVRVVI